MEWFYKDDVSKTANHQKADKKVAYSENTWKHSKCYRNNNTFNGIVHCFISMLYLYAFLPLTHLLFLNDYMSLDHTSSQSCQSSWSEGLDSMVAKYCMPSSRQVQVVFCLSVSLYQAGWCSFCSSWALAADTRTQPAVSAPRSII